MISILSHCKFTVGSQKILKKQCLNHIQWRPQFKISTKAKNHYEVLNLSKNCSTKEIREAYITLSKQYHPDKNKGNPKAQEEFVKVSEAYNVLIKPESRLEYDFSLKRFTEPSRVYKTGKKDDFYEVHRYDSGYRDPWKDPSFYRNRNFSEDNNEDNYYGIKGFKRQTNQQLLFWIFMFVGIGVILQISILRFASTSTRLTREKQSEENRKHLEYVRARAAFYGTRERQLEEFNQRLRVAEDDE
ncbi:dnaJ-like protein 60 [Macrosteles quadrilineatus]|uniref:dnaJ-like protein 60 n=1 Tax=Macrosteles quadrilineatus TaxID=74068 RepID=UPI0023E09CF8|nr:dnaJ-like protein 60 [Macrosteles quadrilineatus]